MAKKLKLYRIAVPEPLIGMYALDERQALAKFRDSFVTAEEASALQIEAHIKAGLPIYGRPEEDERQQPLEGV